MNHMLGTLKWLNIKQRLSLNTLITIFKIKNGLAPRYLHQEIAYVGETQPYDLRNGDDFRIQRAITTKMQKSLFIVGLHLFNRLHAHIKLEKKLLIFKRNCVDLISDRSFHI